MKILLFILLILPALGYAQSAKKYLRIGDRQLDSTKFNEALLSFTKAIQIDSTSTDAYEERAKARQKLRDYKGELADLNVVIKSKPEDISALYYRGFVRMNLKDYNGAIADFTTLTHLQPLNSTNYASRALVKIKLKDFSGAIDDYSTAISANDNNKWSYYNARGNIRCELKDYNGGMDDFKESILLKPSFINYMSKGSLESYQKDYKTAIHDFSEALNIYKQLVPDRSGTGISLIYFKRAEAEIGVKLLKDAQSDCDEALISLPSFAPAYNIRGDLKHQIGDSSGACEDWTTAVSLGDTKAGENLKLYCK